MEIMLSAKGSDVTAWRAVENFAAAYRQALLDQAASDRSGSAETIFSETHAAIETVINTHRKLLKQLNSLIEEVSAETPSTSIKELTIAFYSDLYRYFGHFRSPPAFYELSMAFLRGASATIIAQATDQLGLHTGQLPEIALIAVGPAGRCEYSPFSPLQILLVHGEVAESQRQTINLFCDTLHAGFESAGLAIDPVVTPRNALWRGTLSEWRHRCEEWLHPLEDNKLIDLCRLVDQYPLHPVDRISRELKQISSTALSSNRQAMANLIVRMTSLSNGLSFIGRLKLERSGKERGMFDLLNHGLLPLSAALSALTLIKKSGAVSNCERIRDLLKRHELDVEQAERMLATWHSLNDLRLRREQSFRIDEPTTMSLFLNPNDLTADQQQSLIETLESVAIIQHHVVITFSEMGE